MAYNPEIHHRRSIRLQGYDYSQSGMYYITLVVQHRLPIFGKINNGKMVLNDAGKMVDSVWCDIPKFYSGIDVDEYVVMPNHFHGIVVIDHGAKGPATGGRPNDESIVGDGPRAIPNDNSVEQTNLSLGDIVGRFKSMVITHYIKGVKENEWTPFNKKLWQRNYYEHIIRNEKDYERIVEYIRLNPENWENDKNKLGNIN